jgi:hypothetical protein
MDLNAVWAVMHGLVIPNYEVKMLDVFIIVEIGIENWFAVYFLGETKRTGCACQ